MRRVPLTLREPVDKELDNFLEDDIIELIDPSPWVSNMVITPEQNGNLRLCMDLRVVNK